jgi:GlpG protein
MRQVGTLPTEREAQRFAAWLVSQRIEAHAEQERDAWVIWVRDEDQLPQAREALAHFGKNPDDARYQGAERSAETARREEETRRRQAQGNVVEMRGRWGSAAPGMPGTARRCPIVLTLIALSALVGIVAYEDTLNEGRSGQPPGLIYRNLTFVDKTAVAPGGRIDIWANIRKGQAWRLITPIFIHYGLMHIVLNMVWLYSFGGAVEDRRGSLFMVILVLGLAVLSNVGQALETSLRAQIPLFGGLSGVGYGLFGYVAIKAKFDSRERYFLSPGTSFMAMLWFGLCILRDIPPFAALLADAIPPIANTAHAVGLVAGAVIAYAPLLVRKPA